MATITLQGTPIHTHGNLPETGKIAPDFTMTRGDLSEIRLHECFGKTTILNIFPSLDTPTCAAAMLRFNEIAGLHKDVVVLCVSADLPFSQKRFCSTEHLENVQPVSIFRNPDFGKTYGVQIVDGPVAGLLARSIIVIDKQGKVIHTELVKELANEPDYDAVLGLLTSPSQV